MYVGYKGSGSLRIDAGGSVNARNVSIADMGGATGEIVVKGVGSTLSYSGYLRLGSQGSASLLVSDGGAVSGDKYTYIGNSNTDGIGQALVSGLGSRWETTSSISVIHGELRIENGGVVANSNSSIGSSASAPLSAAATVTDVGSLWEIEGSLSIQEGNNGILSIENGGEVRVAGTTKVYSSATFSGIIHFNNGTLTTGGLVGEPEQLTGAGTINVGSRVADDVLTLNAVNGGQVHFLYDQLPGQNISVNINPTQPNGGTLGAGYAGTGSLSISDGLTVYSGAGLIGNLSGSQGAVYLSGSGTHWTTQTGSLTIGEAGAASLEIDSGAQVTCGYGYVGRRAGSVGDVILDGADSRWDIERILFVGGQGQGSLSIQDGATVTSSSSSLGASATVSVNGSGSTWSMTGGDLNLASGAELAIGSGSVVNVDRNVINSESYNITTYPTVRFSGGVLAANGIILPAESFLGTGTINTRGIITDADLLFDASHGLVKQIAYNQLPGQTITVNLDVSNSAGNGALGAGMAGSGSLSIADGRVVTSSEGYLGYVSGSDGRGIVSGAGSTWNVEGSLYVSYSGNGSLEVLSGGHVQCDEATIGYYDPAKNSSGSVIVSGPGSNWDVSNTLSIGPYSKGSLSIEHGGVVTCGTIALGSDFSNSFREDSEMAVIGIGSQCIISDALNCALGNLRIEDGGYVKSATVTAGDFNMGGIEARVIGGGSTWDTGAYSMVFTPIELQVASGGRIISSDVHLGLLSSALLNGPDSTWEIAGSFELIGGASLTIENGALIRASGQVTATASDVIDLQTGGRLALSGDADGLLPNFLELIEGEIVLNYWNGMTWNSLLNATLGIDYTLEYCDSGDLAGYTLLTVGTIPSGDFDGNGHVDGQDFLSWQRTVGAMGEGLAQDADNNGVVDGSDLVYWSQSFGNIIGSFSETLNAQIIPEPNASILVVIGVCIGFMRRQLVQLRRQASQKHFSDARIATGRLRRSTSLFALVLTVIASTKACGGIYANGDVAPSYDNTDPWIVTDNLKIGDASEGSLVLNSPSIVSGRNSVFSYYSYVGFQPNATGTVNLSGAGSLWNGYSLSIGWEGTGAMTISDGAIANTALFGLGSSGGSHGEATISGGESRLEVSDYMWIGSLGAGAMSLREGATVNAKKTFIGGSQGSIGNVFVKNADTSLTADALYCGEAGNGNLTIEYAARVSAENLYVGEYLDGTGEVVVRGSGSQLSAQFLSVGYMGEGHLDIEYGGLLSIEIPHLTELANGSINLRNGGQLALLGSGADSLESFFSLIGGSQGVNYWNGVNWAPIEGAVADQDYSLQYIADGELTGHTILTVGAPPLEGDYDYNGLVDGGDFLYWQRGDSPHARGKSDLSVWNTAFGVNTAVNATLIPIPEPPSYILTVFALSFIVICHGCVRYSSLLQKPFARGP